MSERVHFMLPKGLWSSVAQLGAKLACEVIYDPDKRVHFVAKPCGETAPQTTSHVEQVTCRACRRSPVFANAKREARWAAQPRLHTLIVYGRRYKCRGRACRQHVGGAHRPRHPLPELEAPVVVKRVVKMHRTRPARDQGDATPTTTGEPS